MKKFLIFIEIVALLGAIFFIYLWVTDTNDLYYKILTILISIVGLSIEIARRILAKKYTNIIQQTNNSSNNVVQNIVNSPNSSQINTNNLIIPHVNRGLSVNGEWNQIDLSATVSPVGIVSVFLLFENEKNTGYIKGVVKSDVDGILGERRFDTSVNDKNPLELKINSLVIYCKIEEVENINHSLSVSVAGVKFER